jgi:hypothetical protein
MKIFDFDFNAKRVDLTGADVSDTAEPTPDVFFGSCVRDAIYVVIHGVGMVAPDLDFTYQGTTVMIACVQKDGTVQRLVRRTTCQRADTGVGVPAGDLDDYLAAKHFRLFRGSTMTVSEFRDSIREINPEHALEVLIETIEPERLTAAGDAGDENAHLWSLSVADPVARLGYAVRETMLDPERVFSRDETNGIREAIGLLTATKN